MATRQKARAAATSTTTVKPPTTAALAGSSAGLASAPQLALRPPLEKALDAFTRELRAALDRSTADSAALRAEVTALRAELEQLRQRHAAHTHTYSPGLTGGGGHHWIELRFLQAYIDAEQPGFTKYGIWTHGKSTADTPAALATSGPSS